MRDEAILKAMLELRRLLEAGHEVTFLRGDAASADRAYECHLITPEGNGVTACGATPAAALAEASPTAALDALAAVTADELGEHPGDVEAAAGSLPWKMDEDGSTWRAQLPDGRTAVIERLDDGDEDGNGASFLPKVHESREDFAAGPVCAGLLGAAAWAAQFAAAAK